VTPVAWMVGAGVGSWLTVGAVVETELNPEALFGMAGPLVAAVVSWIAYDRAHARAPERLMSVLMTAFAVKVLFFGVYVAVMLRVLDLRPIPFVISFTGYFVALYGIEALCLRRLLTEDLRSPRRER